MGDALDFRGVAAEALSRAHDLVPSWLPGGRFAGHEYQCADRHGGKGESFSVNVATGRWAEFGDGAEALRGNDLVSLFAAIHGIKQGEACQRLGGELGLFGPGAPAARRDSPRAVARDEPEGEICRPVPADAPSYVSVLHDRVLGAATHHWRYEDAQGGLLMIVARWSCLDRHGQPDKKIRQFTCWKMPGGDLRWTPKWIPRPRPLYRLRQLAAAPDALVVVVEGEKAAEAGAVLWPDLVWTTSPGGCKSARDADWSPLCGRVVVLWPDADQAKVDPVSGKLIEPAGYGYARAVAKAARAAGAASVRQVDLASLAALRARVMGGIR